MPADTSSGQGALAPFARGPEATASLDFLSNDAIRAKGIKGMPIIRSMDAVAPQGCYAGTEAVMPMPYGALAQREAWEIAAIGRAGEGLRTRPLEPAFPDAPNEYAGCAQTPGP
jgi:hypothetical protein